MDVSYESTTKEILYTLGLQIEHKVRDSDVAKALSLVEKHQAELLTEWSQIHAE